MNEVNLSLAQTLTFFTSCEGEQRFLFGLNTAGLPRYPVPLHDLFYCCFQRSIEQRSQAVMKRENGSMVTVNEQLLIVLNGINSNLIRAACKDIQLTTKSTTQ